MECEKRHQTVSQHVQREAGRTEQRV